MGVRVGVVVIVAVGVWVSVGVTVAVSVGVRLAVVVSVQAEAVVVTAAAVWVAACSGVGPQAAKNSAVISMRYIPLIVEIAKALNINALSVRSERLVQSQIACQEIPDFRSFMSAECSGILARLVDPVTQVYIGIEK